MRRARTFFLLSLHFFTSIHDFSPFCCGLSACRLNHLLQYTYSRGYFPSHHLDGVREIDSSAYFMVLFISRLKTYQELLTTILLAYFVRASSSLFLGASSVCVCVCVFCFSFLCSKYSSAYSFAASMCSVSQYLLLSYAGCCCRDSKF